MDAQGGVAGQPRDGEPEDAGGPDGVPVDLVAGDLQVRRTGLAVEVQGEGVGREELAEGDGRVEVPDGDDVAGVDAEALHLAGDESPEGVVADSGDHAGAVPEAGGRDRDVRRGAPEELPEGLHVLEVAADLEGVDVDSGAPHGQEIDMVAFH